MTNPAGLRARPLSPRAKSVAAMLGLALTLAACGGQGVTGDNADGLNPYHLTTTGPGVLTVSPLDTTMLSGASPLGYLAPPGHVLPTDHVYLYFADFWSGQVQNVDCSMRPVRAAGSGVVSFVYVTEAAGDTKVDIQMTKTFHYYYDHVILKPGIVPGAKVTVGDTIATTAGHCPSMDLGVYDLDVTHPGLLNAKRYADQTAHVVSPYQYFSEPLRTWFYAHSRMLEGVPANKDGRVDWGVRGRLVGDWFHTSLDASSVSSSNGPTGWAKSLSFAYDWYDNTQPRISIGGTIADAGVLRIAPSDPDPSTVSPASGIVAYQGTPTLGRIASGWLLVQMLTDERVRVEYFPDATSRPVAFTTAAQEYVR